MKTHAQNLSSVSLLLHQKQNLFHRKSAWIAIAFKAFMIGSLNSSPAALAQTRLAPAEPTLSPVIISAPAPRAQISVGGFGDQSLVAAPISGVVIDSAQMHSSGAQRLSDLYKFDASISDAYNAVGYIDYATVRGFVIDNKFNIRRDGMPISGDTAIGLANKDRVEILKGTSGIQASTSAPGGLVNYIVKRPPMLTSQPVRRIDLSLDSNGQWGAALDLGGRFGQAAAQGYRLNVATDRLQNAAVGTRGDRQQLALALDSRMGSSGLLEAEFEWSRQSQPNVPGLSVLGASGLLPSADPKLNLNRQTWSQPTQFGGLTGSLHYTQALNDQWSWSAHLSSQRLKTNDRIAFPFGCTAEGIFDRYCSNGDTDIYDFRSDGERRSKQAAQLKIDGSFQTGRLKHSLSLGLLQSASRIQTPDSAFNYAGTININNPAQPVPASPALTSSGNTQREKTTEFFATDVIAWNDSFKTWLGLRHTRLQRSDALNASNYSRSFTTPWLATSYTLPHAMLYASHGQGMESDTAPTAWNVANIGQVLPPRRSRQSEIGIKSKAPQAFSWQVAAFSIERPVSNLDACGLNANSACIVAPDGQSVHQGLEVSMQWQAGAWQLGGSATTLHVRREGSRQAPAINGLKPTNVPRHILRANAAYRVTPNWLVSANLNHESRRAILPDNSLMLAAWTRFDASLEYKTQINNVSTAWQLSIDNLLDKRYFKESPYQFGHAYLFAGAPRTLRLSASFAL
jgi:iron complex outermembrane recepter protein